MKLSQLFENWQNLVSQQDYIVILYIICVSFNKHDVDLLTALNLLNSNDDHSIELYFKKLKSSNPSVKMALKQTYTNDEINDMKAVIANILDK